jgi:enoyl-CoA hydratase/carnithine racemase
LLRALRERALPAEVERELVDLREPCFSSEDFREGMRAFAEKRAPVWRDR